MTKGCILINRNICDKAPECGGIAVCPTAALYWDENKKQVAYNADSCTACKQCANTEIGCPIEAIRFAATEEEYAQIEEEIARDTRKLEDLQVERYGATPIENSISIEELEGWLEEQDKTFVLFVELFTDDSIQCLLHSIKVEDIQALVEGESKYIKVQLTKEEDITNPTIEEVPSLLIYQDNKLLGKIEGYYDESEQEDFFNEIRAILERK